MVSVKDVYDYINILAPFSSKMDFDNVGLLAGISTDEVKKIIVSLDITDEVIEEAAACGANLIVSHHPLFFSLKCVSDLDPNGKKAAAILRNGMSAICAHTNLDAARGGVNDVLAKKAGIVNPRLLCVEGVDENGNEYCIGRMGEIKEEMELEDYLRFLKDSLNVSGLRYVSGGKKVKKVAVVGGSGMSMLDYVLAGGCDTFITADIKYNGFLDAKEGGYNLIDADHFGTENVVVPYLAEKLRDKFKDIDIMISKKHCQSVKFL